MVKLADKTATLETKNGFRFEADAEALNAGLGDTFTFEIIKNDASGMTFRQALTQNAAETVNAKQLSTEEMRGLMKQNNLLADASDKSAEDQRKTAAAISKIKRQLNYTQGNLTADAVAELVANGLSINKITIDVLSSVLKEIEKKPAVIKPDGAPPPSAINPAKNAAINPGIIKNLEAHGLPVNDQNIHALESALRKYERLGLDDEAAAALLRQDKELTIDNIYVAQFSSKTTDGQPDLPRDTFDTLRAQIEATLAREGVAPNEKNYQIAEYLIKNHIPVTKPHIDKYIFLINLPNSADPQAMLASACGHLQNGKSAGAVDLYTLTDQTARRDAVNALKLSYGELIESVKHINPLKIEVCLNEGIPLTLAALCDDAYAGLPQSSGFTPVPAPEAVAARRQLAEIQLKLTFEAAYRLAGKLINIETLPLEEAVNSLRNAEKDIYAGHLRLRGDAAPERVAGMAGLFDKLHEFNNPPVKIFHSFLTEKNIFNIDNVHKHIVTAKLTAGYETFATVANPKFGDSFNSIKNEIAPFLARLPFEPDEGDVRAAAVLIKNDVDVTVENLLKIKILSAKIDAVYERLLPSVAADMINEGLNPAVMHIDDVLLYIDARAKLTGISREDTIAAHILELDKHKTLGGDERASVIAVYRMLNIIKKDNGAALGVSLKFGGNPVLGDLLNDAKNYVNIRKHKAVVDAVIDEYSGVSELSAPEDNIGRILSEARGRAAESAADALSEARALLERAMMADNAANIEKASDVIETAPPRPVAALLDYELFTLNADKFIDNADAPPLSELLDAPGFAGSRIEQAAEQLKSLKNQTGANERVYDEHIRQIQNLAAPVILWIKENGIKPTVQNLIAADALYKNPHFIYDAINALPKELYTQIAKNIPEGFGDLSFSARVSEALMDIRGSSVDGELKNRIDLIQNAVKINDFLGNRDARHYQVPVRLHDKIGTLDMYIVNPGISAGSGIKIFMSLNMTGLGDVTAILTAAGGRAQLTVDAKPETAAFLSGFRDELAETFSSSGTELTELSFNMSGNKIDPKPVHTPFNKVLTGISEYEYLI